MALNDYYEPIKPPPCKKKKKYRNYAAKSNENKVGIVKLFFYFLFSSEIFLTFFYD